MKSISEIKKEIEKTEQSKEGYVPDLLQVELIKYIKYLEERIKILEEK